MSKGSDLDSPSSNYKGAAIHFLQGERLAELPEQHPLIPVITISVQPADLGNPLNPFAGSKKFSITALIDTGADGMYIDADFAERNGFQSDRTTTVSSASHTTEEKVYPALFELPDSASHYRQAADFVSSPLRENGRKYDAVLGMQLLSNGVLVMDFDSHVYRFEFTTKANK